MNSFINEDGTLNLEGMIAEQPSFAKLLETGTISEEALEQQGLHVKDLLIKADETFSPEQMVQIRELLAETSVLITALSIFDRQHSQESEENN